MSSLQLDRVERGFSYSKDAPLDMRMDATSPLTAEVILPITPKLSFVVSSTSTAKRSCLRGMPARSSQAREIEPFTRSAQLVDLIIAATPAAVQRAGHPAKRVFQALRIEVNQELSVLTRAIPAAIDSLELGGRMVVLAYQSLEDRIVKRVLATRSSSTAPAGLPIELPSTVRNSNCSSAVPNKHPKASEIINPRATPVRLRAVERLRTAS